MEEMFRFLQRVAPYRGIFLLLSELIFAIILISLAKALWKKLRTEYEENKKLENQPLLKHAYKADLDEVERQNAIRQIIAADGVDASPNTYMGVSDGGREVYVRSVTISKLPKRVRFAETLKPLMNFPNCTSTAFVESVDVSEISRKLDRQINILESEQIVNKDNPNRVRKLYQQEAETTRWASEVEMGDKKFFYCGFLFTFFADSVEELNKITDSFRSVALNKKMDISNCYAVQGEAYLSGLPINRRHFNFFSKIGSDAVKMHLMDQESVSVILNYTTDYFTHKKGIPLGRNLFTQMPFVFDIYDPSHDGFTVVICGKTNSGKSATIKMMEERYIPLGYRFVSIDSQTRKGTSEGEYSSVTEINGGVNFQISSKNENILNIFDVQESTAFVKESANSGHEIRTLDLNGSITEMVYNLRSMMQIGANDKDRELDAVMDSDIDSILRKAVKELFLERGICHGSADSLYEEGAVVRNGLLQSGYVHKKLPTMTDFFQKILQYKWTNKDAALEGAYKLIVNNLCEYVRELYYCEEEHLFFTKVEYDAMPSDQQHPGQRLFLKDDDEYVPVKALMGIRPYFDGQSTLNISRDCPVTNIDISQLTELERKIAREIAVRFVNERFVKKNSEKLDGSDKLVVVVDEAHENFEYEYGRKIFANMVRTARKRNVGCIFSTQTVAEFERYDETADILRQAAVKMIFKQDGKDRELLKNTLNITDSQAHIITNRIGVVTDKSDPHAKTKHRGEMCVIDGEDVLFVKVDYLKSVEKLAVETDASTVITLNQKGA